MISYWLSNILKKVAKANKKHLNRANALIQFKPVPHKGTKKEVDVKKLLTLILLLIGSTINIQACSDDSDCASDEKCFDNICIITNIF